MRNEKVFKISFEFVNNKNKEILKQKFYNYSRKVAIENVKKTIKLRRAKLTSEKKIIIFLLHHLCIQKNYIKDEIIVFASR